MRSSLWVLAVAALLGSDGAMAQGAPGRPGGGPGPGQQQGPDQQGPSQRPSHPPAHHRPPPQHRPPVHRPPPQAGFRPQHRPPHHFLSQGRYWPSIHGPRFAYPPGYGYRLWAAGAILPAPFLSAAYFYDGYAALGLAPPPPGYRWVRYGPDLLLVQVFTGRIADVVEGVFY